MVGIRHSTCSSQCEHLEHNPRTPCLKLQLIASAQSIAYPAPRTHRHTAPNPSKCTMMPRPPDTAREKSDCTPSSCIPQSRSVSRSLRTPPQMCIHPHHTTLGTPNCPHNSLCEHLARTLAVEAATAAAAVARIESSECLPLRSPHRTAPCPTPRTTMMAPLDSPPESLGGTLSNCIS